MVRDDAVVLLDEEGSAIGEAPKEAIHGDATPLHLAFSCYLFDAAGRVLLTRRALSKRSWPGVWTNSFCGHPAPGEAIEDAVRRHAASELGIAIDDLRPVLADFRYRAVDASGIVENELCPVYIARTADDLAPSPSEVAEFAWVAPQDLLRTVAATPQLLSPWCVLQVPRIASVLTDAVMSP